MIILFRRFLFLSVWVVSSVGRAQGDTRPLRFIENKNQWPDNIQFSASLPGSRMSLFSGGFMYYFLDTRKMQDLHERLHHAESEPDGATLDDVFIDGHAVRVLFDGANMHTQPKPFGKSDEYYNYFIGNDPSRWASHVHAYTGVYYPDLYEGIGLKVYAFGGNIKYDFIVAPNADPYQILVCYEGANPGIKDGDLHVETPLGGLIEKRPIAYQFIEGKKVLIPCEYRLEGAQLSFSFPGGYDPCYELIIDPLLIFSTYSGSTADNWGSTATPGEKGSLYSAGVTTESSGGKFPATAGAFQTLYAGLYDVAILKYDSAGRELLYASYLGGVNSESPHSLVMNAQGELIVLGTTSSYDFPTTSNAYDRDFGGGTTVTHVVPYDYGSDIFIARISRDGSQLLASTFVGGSRNDGLNPNNSELTRNYGDQLRGDVITDSFGNIYISSVTASPDLVLTNSFNTTYNGGATDALLLKLDPDLSTIIWGAFLGGSGTDAAYTIKFDSKGDIYVAGGSTSNNFPVTPGSYQENYSGGVDGWIAHLSGDGSTLLHATFTGKSSYDQIYFLDLDSDDGVYVYGQSSSTDFPVTPGVYTVGMGQFVQKFDSQLSALQFSTVFGSSRQHPDISPTAFLVNECNNLYMAGWGGVINSASGFGDSSTEGLPVTPDAFQATTSGSDFYFIVLTDDASELLYATFFGGTLSRTHVDGGTSRFDKSGIVYHAVCAGCAALNATVPPVSTSDFPTTPGAWSNFNRSRNCNNAAFKFDLSSLKARIRSNSVRLDQPGLSFVCFPDKIVFQNFSTGGEIFKWDLGDGTTLTKTDTSAVVHQYTKAGKYVVRLKAIDEGTCKVVDSTSVMVTVDVPEAWVQNDDDLCADTPYTLKATGGASYEWKSVDGTFTSHQPQPTVVPSDTTRYVVTVTEASGCITTDTVQLNVIPKINPAFRVDRTVGCISRPFITVTNLTDSLRAGDEIFFDLGDGTVSDLDDITHHFKQDGFYTVKLVARRAFCVYEKEVSVPVFTLTVPNVITFPSTPGMNDTFVIQYGDNPGDTPLTYGFKVSLNVYNRWGKIVYQNEDYRYDWSGEGLPGGVYFFEVQIEDHTVCKSWIHLIK